METSENYDSLLLGSMLVPSSRQSSLSPFMMWQVSQPDRIEQLRDRIKQQGYLNSILIYKNQESLKSVLNPAITREEYSILGNKRLQQERPLDLKKVQN